MIYWKKLEKICDNLWTKVVYIMSFFVLWTDYSNAKDYRHIDSVMRICPAQHTQSAENIARHIEKKFSSANDKLRAAYSWVSQHVNYDISKMYAGITYKHESEVVKQVLKTRKTVCFGYVVTFKAIVESLGLKIIVIKGYTKQNGKVDAIPHAWCAVRYGDEWRLIDPTWSAGYLSSGVFHKRFNDKWFLVKPTEIIKSHIPFDPVWQFSYFPVNSNEFLAGRKADSVTSRFFNYPDTIRAIEKLSEKERLISENGRILAMGYSNHMITKYIDNNKMTVEHIVYNENVEIYNKAVNLYNSASSFYNKRNMQSAKLKLNEALQIINNIQNPDKDMSVSIRNLREMINKLESQIGK
jgi:transglutaminase/protease-like cytokinesis protein 3